MQRVKGGPTSRELLEKDPGLPFTVDRKDAAIDPRRTTDQIEAYTLTLSAPMLRHPNLGQITKELPCRLSAVGPEYMKVCPEKLGRSIEIGPS
jgi:hypothetical protein